METSGDYKHGVYLQFFIFGDSSIYSLILELRLWVDIRVEEQPYKSRDMVGSGSGLGRLLVNGIVA